MDEAAAASLHQWVAEYNWDDGLDAIGPIVESNETEFATALMIYWRLGGPWLEADASPVSTLAVDLQQLVRRRLLAGYYPKVFLRYRPVEDNQLSKVQVFKLKKGDLPIELIEPYYPY